MFHERKMQYLKNVDSPQFSLWVQGHSATFQQRFACEPRRTLTFLWRASRAEAGLLAPEGHGGQSPTDTEGLAGQRWRGEQTARLHRRCAVHPKPGPAHPKTEVQRRKPQTSEERPRRGVEGPTDGDSRSDGVHKSSNKRRLNPAGRGLRKDPSLHRKTAPARRKRSRVSGGLGAGCPQGPAGHPGRSRGRRPAGSADARRAAGGTLDVTPPPPRALPVHTDPREEGRRRAGPGRPSPQNRARWTRAGGGGPGVASDHAGAAAGGAGGRVRSAWASPPVSPLGATTTGNP